MYYDNLRTEKHQSINRQHKRMEGNTDLLALHACLKI